MRDRCGIITARYYRGCGGHTGRKKLTQQALVAAPVQIPPLPEQTEIVSQVEAKLSNIAQAETEIKRSLECAARLRQAILKRAFEGRLV
jgi:type I restriction enzyme S subunit